MAIVKHKSGKNVCYADVLDYYSYKHTEDPDTGHYEPILDEYGLKQQREDYTVAYITAYGDEDAPEKWASACIRTNYAFGKNGDYKDVKNHEYIISHPAADRPKMTMEDLLTEGKAFVQANLRGYDALIAVHRDTDNDHVHITINSVRALQREEEPWMVKNSDGSTKPCEMAAGGKHQDSAAFRRHCNDWLLEYTRAHGLEVKDNNVLADRHKEERQERYDAATGGNLTVHQRQLREAFLKARSTSGSLQELTDTLMADYGIKLIQRGHTISLLHPEKSKADRLRTLGLDDSFLQFDDAPTELEEPTEQQTGSPPPENKTYVQRLTERRAKNSEKVKVAIGQADAVVNEKLKPLSKRKRRGNGTLTVSKLDALIQKTLYAQKDLQTEAGRLDTILERWQQSQDPTLPPEERQRHKSYLERCGLTSTAWITEYCLEISQELTQLSETRDALRQKKFSAGNEFYPESRKYFQWLRERRLDNTGKAEDTITRAEEIISRKLRSGGKYYSEGDFRELNYLIRKTTYVERDLQTEKDKLDALLDRWQKYQDTTLPRKEHLSHENFLRWCGCEPDSPIELEYLRIQRELTDLQIQHIVSVREGLMDTTQQWNGVNETPASKRTMALDRERQLKHQLQDVRANRVQLGEIATNCQRAVRHRVYKEDALAKADFFRGKWMETLDKEKKIQQQLSEVRRQKREMGRPTKAVSRQQPRR